MTETFLNGVVIVFFTVIPVLLLIFQLYFSTRKKLALGFIIPGIWTVMGLWMITSNQKHGSEFIKELILFFILGDAILLALLGLCKYVMKKKNEKAKKK